MGTGWVPGQADGRGWLPVCMARLPCKGREHAARSVVEVLTLHRKWRGKLIHPTAREVGRRPAPG